MNPPATPALKDRNVLAKTREVIAYQRDETRPGRPVSLLLAGGGLALGTLALILWFAYRTWVQHQISEDNAYWAVGLLFVNHAFGIYVFAYGYELYDIGKALRLTLKIAFVSVVAILTVIAVLTVLSKSKGGGGALKGLLGGSQNGEPLVKPVGWVIGAGDEVRFEGSGISARRERPEDVDPFGPLMVTCTSCSQRFSPVPPDATCPFCGHSALTPTP